MCIRDSLYGDRTLITRGLVPAEVVLGHPAFLRPCAGINQAGACLLYTSRCV